ncbi:P-loop NTPase family protein [Thermosynechococcus sp.]|uniref:P-loop NTPase family protein n=1 Tax=Thermosynechococcus sp. TaxID=2814275 RepID=UPI003918A701
MVAQLSVSVSEAGLSPTYGIEGVVQVFTCPQRHFFTTVMAQALRVAAQGSRVLVVQFLKGGIQTGIEHPIQLGQHLTWWRPALQRCLEDAETITPEEKAAVWQLWQHLQATVQGGEYRLAVLDEVSVAIQLGLLSEAEVLDFLKNRPRTLDVVLTGPDMPASLLAIADQVTELRRLI